MNRYESSEVMEFDGDIIITDPCYIIKPMDKTKEPKGEDYFSYPNVTDYPDYDPALGKSDMRNAEYKKWVADFNKWYDEEDDWEKCKYGEDMEALGIRNSITKDTLYGDWSCTTYNSDTEEEIGQFCADAGMVSVFLLDEVLKYNPGFNYHSNKPWTTTWIRDFKGTVQIVVIPYGDDEYDVEVVGHGVNKVTGEPINFIGRQTGY